MHKVIAQWLYDMIMKDGEAYQRDVVEEIEQRFGEDYVYENENGNLAIDKKITAEFRKLNNKGLIEWDRSGFFWFKA
ncbi:DUF6953 family protein [Gorillibacterium massiliense]|uniref:DUF6953 family protein n=1 Tax=Gorillibacterium massiliense TaxID=1280390 RepID=UPI0004B32837|nr:hypothetical protein [Gorillibacterium massiliense]